MSTKPMTKKELARIEQQAKGKRFPWTCPECSRAHTADDTFCMCGIVAPRAAEPEDTLKLIAEVKRLRELEVGWNARTR